MPLSMPGWPPSTRPPYDRLPPGWLTVDDAIELAGRLVFGGQDRSKSRV